MLSKRNNKSEKADNVVSVRTGFFFLHCPILIFNACFLSVNGVKKQPKHKNSENCVKA